MSRRHLTLASIAAIASFVGGPIAAQQSPDLAPYLIPERAAEVALARSSAPKNVTDSARVLVLTRTGSVEAAPGTNGFTCLVVRSFLGGLEDPGYWSPKVRAPTCYNPPASRTTLVEILKRAEWVMAGVTQSEIAKRTERAFASRQFPLPTVGAMAYMLSPEQYLGDADPHWMPHVMFYYDRSLPAAAWGAGDMSAPIINASFGTPNSPVQTLFIPVRQWSNGTPAGSASNH